MIPNEYGGQLRVSMPVTACRESRQIVNYLEHVQCKITLTYVPRGNLRILLTSPSGTVSTLLFERPRDVTGSSFDRWPFMSVHFWGENPRGVWNLTIINTHTRAPQTKGILKEWQLIFYGTEQQPIELLPSAEQQFGSGSILHQTVVNQRGRSVTSSDCGPRCSDACVTLPDGAECSNCRTQHKSSCIPSCGAGAFFSGSGGCQACHPTCASCHGPRPEQCQACAVDHFLVRELELCSPSCPDGHYPVSGACEQCRPDCASCAGASGRCLSCDPHLILHDQQCWLSCPRGTYEDIQTCEPCSPGCEECSGPDDCLACRPGSAALRGHCVSLP